MAQRNSPAADASAGNETHSKKSTRAIFLTLLAIFALGIFARLWIYGHRESFWKDETGLARNFLTHDLAHIHQPFGGSQAAPIGFCQVSKLIEMALGHNEHAFWLWPLTLGILSIFAAAVVFRKQLPTGAWLLAVAALAFNPTLIDHITQLKPYLSDSFWALVMVGTFFYVSVNIFKNNSLDKKSIGNFQQSSVVGMNAATKESGFAPYFPWIVYLIVGLLCLWMSYTSVFVIAGLGLWLIIEALLFYRKNYKTCDKNNLKNYSRQLFLLALLVNVILATVFIFLWTTNYSLLDADGGFRRFWKDNFAPVPLTPAALGWYAQNLGSVVGYLFGATQWMLLFFFIALGVVKSWGLNRRLLALLLPIALTFIASWLGAYPVYDRLEVFWTPLLLPFLALGVYGAWELLARQHRGITAVFVLFVALPYLAPLHVLGDVQDPQQLKQAALLVTLKAQAGDVIYVHPRAVELYRYYFKRRPPHAGVAVELGSAKEAEDLGSTLARRFAGKRVFVLYAEPSFTFNEILQLASHAQQTGELVGVAELNLAGVMEVKVK